MEFRVFELIHVSSKKHNLQSLNQICPNRVFPVQYHHRIQHIGFSLEAKFHLKQAIFIFWTKLAQTG